MTWGRGSARSGRAPLRRPILVVSGALLFAVIIATWLGWNVWHEWRVSDESRTRLMRQEYLYGVILRLDEVLTMSARMNALLGERRWESRYLEHARELDAAVAEAGSFASSCSEAINATAAANDRLVEMELHSFDLVNASREGEARSLLLSPTYEEQKRIYREGMEQFIASCREHADAALSRDRDLAAGILAVTYGLLLLSLGVALRLLRRGVVRPLYTLAAASGTLATDAGEARVLVTSDDAVGALQSAFNEMAAQLGAQRVSLRQQNAELEAKQAELEEYIGRQARLLHTIQELSTPVLPLMDGVLVLPLVGTVDEDRAAALTQALLHSVTPYDAHTAILDVTGISAMNASVMRLLLAAVKAARLMGTRVVLSGLTPAMASIIVREDIDVLELETMASLRDALATVLAADGDDGGARLATGGAPPRAEVSALDRVRLRVSTPHT